MSTNYVFLAIFCGFFAYKNYAQNIHRKVTENFELSKYLGTWYEIARFPHRFEKDLVGVTAQYSIREDGMVNVVNQGYLKTLDGEVKVAIGKAKLADKPNVGKLKVSFFWIFYAPYHILVLDELDYQYALVGSSSMNYLWILNRKPQMNEETYNRLVNRAKEMGYNTEKLIKVEHKL